MILPGGRVICNKACWQLLYSHRTSARYLHKQLLYSHRTSTRYLHMRSANIQTPTVFQAESGTFQSSKRTLAVVSGTTETMKMFDLLSKDQRTYLQRVSSDFQAILESSTRQSVASDRYTRKFSVLNDLFQEYTSILDDIAECHKLLDDDEIREAAETEVAELKEQLDGAYRGLEGELARSLQGTTGDVVLEVTMATGGMESSLFARDLLNLYQTVALEKGYTWTAIEESIVEGGCGISKAIIDISGDDVYSIFQHEAGVHRVQRVPITDAVGRVHTSTAIVIVTLKPDNVSVTIEPEDLEITFERASGPGGQGVHATFSKCFMLHKPTGTRVTSQKNREAVQNKKDCLTKLHSILFMKKILIADSQQESIRRKQAKHGDRSDRIRTYNYPSNRITDHRAGVTVHTSSMRQYFKQTDKFFELHRPVCRYWQLRTLSEIAESISESAGLT